MVQFVPTPQSLLVHPRCAACGECLVCAATPHRCPALSETESQDTRAAEAREMRPQ